jgi:hypothetical protein
VKQSGRLKVTDDKKNKFTILTSKEVDSLIDEALKENPELTQEELNSTIDEVLEESGFGTEELDPVEQLMHFRNLKMYLNKMVGKQWLLMYRREEDGSPVYVPNEYLTAEDQVFLSELSKNIVFNMMSFMGEGD